MVVVILLPGTASLAPDKTCMTSAVVLIKGNECIEYDPSALYIRIIC